VDGDGDGVPESRVYFSLDSVSPSLASLGRTAGDILVTSGGAAPALYASRAALGLAAGDDIDGLCLREDGDGMFEPGVDAVAFSLRAGSPTLSAIGAGPGTVLSPGAPPTASVTPGALGLQAGDDLDAVSCGPITAGPKEPDGDVNCNGSTDAIDAALVLQLTAGLIDELSCGENADVNQDGSTNAIDGALILQFAAGLIDHLPFP
jgi:hypothetical protein